MERETVENRYYKQGENLMSGLPLPTDDDGIVSNKHFIKCEFHPNCASVDFVNCLFTDCEGDDYLTKDGVNKFDVR